MIVNTLNYAVCYYIVYAFCNAVCVFFKNMFIILSEIEHAIPLRPIGQEHLTKALVFRVSRVWVEY